MFLDKEEKCSFGKKKKSGFLEQNKQLGLLVYWKILKIKHKEGFLTHYLTFKGKCSITRLHA